MPSFRWRLALANALFAGLVLAAFGFSAYTLIRNAKVERIEGSLRLHAEREVNRLMRTGVRPNLEAQLVSSLGLGATTDLLILLQDDEGEIVWRSAHWPQDLDPAGLAWQSIEPLSVNDWSLIAMAQAQEPPRRHPPPLPTPDRPPHERGDAANGNAPHPPPWQRRPPSPRDGGAGDPRPPRVAPAPVATGALTAPAVIPLPPSASTADTPVQESTLPPPANPMAPADAPSTTAPRPRPPRSTLTTIAHNDNLWRFALAGNEQVRVALGVNLRSLDTEMRSVRNAFLFALPIALILLGFGAWWVAGRALRPVRTLTQAVRQITADDLDHRIDRGDADAEFSELIEVFNRMLARLQRSFQQAQRFSADAAHELKTPLAILQGQLERAIHAAPEGTPEQARLVGILDEVQRLATISRKLLLLAQADTGSLRLNLAPFDLSASLFELVEDARLLAPQLMVTAQIPSGLVIQADGALLTQVFHNLLSNAIKYNLPRGWIKINVDTNPHLVEVRITNASAGISSADRDRIFERFFRADSAHNRSVDGSGLGLALSREIVRAHNGTLGFTVGEDGEVTLTLTLRCHRDAVTGK